MSETWKYYPNSSDFSEAMAANKGNVDNSFRRGTFDAQTLQVETAYFTFFVELLYIFNMKSCL